MRPEVRRKKRAEEQKKEEERARIMAIEDPQRRAYELKRLDDYSVFRNMLPFLPANLKQFVYDLLGGQKTFDINDLTDKEVALLQEVVLPLIPEDAKPGDIIDLPYETWGSDYSDITTPKRGWLKDDPTAGDPALYGGLTEEEQREMDRLVEEQHPGATTPTDKNIIQLMQDPLWRLKTLFGHARIEINEQGQPVLVDRYNFDEDRTAKQREAQGMGSITDRPLYNIPRSIAGAMGSESGEGSQVKIVIPPVVDTQQNSYKGGGFVLNMGDYGRSYK